MLLPINTTVELSAAVATEVFNVAVRGGCDGWGSALGLERHAEHAHLVIRAEIVALDGSLSGTVTVADVGTGITRLLADPSTPAAIRRRVLRVIIDDDSGAVCSDLAGRIMRAALAH